MLTLLEEMTKVMTNTRCYFEIRAYQDGLVVTCCTPYRGVIVSSTRTFTNDHLYLMKGQDIHALIHIMVEDVMSKLGGDPNDYL